MNINPLRRSQIKKKAKKHKESAPWRRKKVRLNASEMYELREYVFRRSNGQCENEFKGERCKARLTWVMSELHHVESRGRGGSDAKENCLLVCPACHRMHHDSARHPRITPHADWEA